MNALPGGSLSGRRTGSLSERRTQLRSHALENPPGLLAVGVVLRGCACLPYCEWNGTACVGRVPICSTLLNPLGLHTTFFTSPGDSTCEDLLQVTFTPTSAGGVQVDWQARERQRTVSACEDVGMPRTGRVVIEGACCAGHVDVPVPKYDKTIRLEVQTDWQARTMASLDVSASLPQLR